MIETVWLDNPPVNAVNSGIIETLWNAFENLSPDVNVVVLRGKGERAFSAGADITGFVGGASEGDRPAGIQPVRPPPARPQSARSAYSPVSRPPFMSVTPGP